MILPSSFWPSARTRIRGSLFIAAGVVAWFVILPDARARFHALLNGTEYLGREGVVLQTSPNNCGPSALKMVLAHHGAEVPLPELEAGIPMTGEGASMLALKEAAARYGVEADGWRLTFEDLRMVPLPALVFVDCSHFVVVDSIEHHTVFLRDPGVGRLAVPQDRFAERWSGETLLFRQ